MSTQFREFARQGGFATVSVATFFAPKRSFVMCNIGNPPPLVFRARDRSWQVLHGETEAVDQGVETPEGVVGPEEYRHIKTKLDVDDIVVIYGNGFAQSKFPGGNMVAHQRLLDALQDSPHSEPKSRLDHLVRLILDNNDPEEDNTIIISQVTNTGVRLRDNLLAPLRLFRRPRDATRLTRHD
jgi:serine phosphatase RsbU (regulator of sigma subunit)